MQVLLLLVAALGIILLTEVVKRYVVDSPHAIAAVFSVLAVLGPALAAGRLPDIPALVNGLYLYIAATLGYDKAIKPLLTSVRQTE